MFNKVLIVDDHDVVNEGVLSILKDNNIDHVDKAQYCDEAALKIKRAVLDKRPYDLLITDLSFKKDFHEGNLLSGEDLVAAIRPEHPHLKIIVYSMEDRLQRVRTLLYKHKINAYVCKGRKGASELNQAISSIYKNNVFLSPQVENALNTKTDLEIDDYDIEVVRQLSKGLSRNDISIFLKRNNLSPSSTSSVEKRINKLKEQFRANNAIHLVAIVKDLGLI